MPIATLSTARSCPPYSLAFGHESADALCDSERREYGQLASEARRRDWLAGRLAAKRAVAARCDLPLDAIRLVPRSGAAPLCLGRPVGGGWAPLGVSISIAHRGGVGIAAAFDDGDRVGLDIDHAGAVHREHTRYFLAPFESTGAEHLDPTLLWVLKEAAWKALALGQDVPFTALRLAFDGDGALRSVSVEGTWMAARAHVLHVPAAHPLVAAMFVIEPEWS